MSSIRHDWAPYGPRLRQVREASGFTQLALSRAADMSENMLGCIERGSRSPSFGAFLGLCRALGITPAQFFTSEGTNP